ncbi:Phage-related protein, tail component [Azotobacter beijerinckii]|uniref:Phage-related protein, tail component n=1 Tax=Azotobacter beijerinckii TaxID=170623 RepID=A0A1H6XQP9_9GAMM|nr:tail assembly protein [Azotobacter beijerinckii]SEJ31393.1 Phage-related protein, tail component [Azotobacter beijerinckii]
MTMTTIKLSGSLAKAFGREHRRQLDSGTTHEAFRALKHTLPGFEAFIREAEKKGLRYAIFRNRRNVGEVEFELGGTQEIRIVPVIAGRKSGGIFQTVLGAALIAAAAFMPAAAPAALTGSLMSIGTSMAIGGVIQMLSPQAKGLSTREDPDNKPSYAFGGPVNTTAQGNPVGVLYGKRRIGGAIISAGIHAEDQM